MTIDEIMMGFAAKNKIESSGPEGPCTLIRNPDKVIYLSGEVGMYWRDEDDPDVTGKSGYGSFVRLTQEGEWVFQDHKLIIEEDGSMRLEWIDE